MTKEGTKRNSADSASAEPCDVMLNRSDRQGFGSVFVWDKKWADCDAVWHMALLQRLQAILVPGWNPNPDANLFFTNFYMNSYKQINIIVIQIVLRIRTRCGFCTNSYIFYTNCIVRIHRTKSMTYVNSYKSDGMNSKKYPSEKNGGCTLSPRYNGIRR